jgi:phosphatidylglycerol:prolipoprotein diacylglycerol transferase
MYLVLFEIGGLQVTSFGVFMALSFLTAGWILSGELKRKGEEPALAWDLVWYVALGGIVGAKLYYLVLNWPETAADPWGAATSRGGLVWYGGLIGAAALIVWHLRRHRLPVLRVADAVAPALAGVERFIVEIFRAKDDRFFGPFTVAQTISLAPGGGRGRGGPLAPLQRG